MKAEFPDWFDLSADFTGIEGGYGEYNGIPCDMIRLGVRCGNMSHLVLSYNRPDKLPVFLAMCEVCSEAWAANAGERTTAYWRKKQREWGVRCP